MRTVKYTNYTFYIVSVRFVVFFVDLLIFTCNFLFLPSQRREKRRLEKEKKMDAEMFTRMTSNNFLNSLGNPTKVEAKIGLIFNGLILL